MMGRRYHKLQEQEQRLGSAVVGIAADLARSMLIDAFIRAVIDTIEPKSLRDHLKGIVTTKHAEVSIGQDDLHQEAKRLEVT